MPISVEISIPRHFPLKDGLSARTYPVSMADVLTAPQPETVSKDTLSIWERSEGEGLL